MAVEWWTPIASIAGVIVGGGLTFITQRTTQHATERAEERKRQAALVEARRIEQIQALTDFIRFAHEAEGVAHARPASWELGDDWYRTARPAMDGLRVAEKTVELLCNSTLLAPVAGYARALNLSVWQERDDVPLGERLEPFKSAFLAAARDSLGSTTSDSPATGHAPSAEAAPGLPPRRRG